MGCVIYTRKSRTPILVSPQDFDRLNQMTWCISTKGYAATNVKTQSGFRFKFMQRLLLEVPQGFVIDHINGTNWTTDVKTCVF